MNKLTPKSIVTGIYKRLKNLSAASCIRSFCLASASALLCCALIPTASAAPTTAKHPSNLWRIISTEFTLPHYANRPEVASGLNWLMHNKTFIHNTANRAAPYLYFIHQQVKKHRLPSELVLIPIIESGYNPFNLSIAGAAGIWQMMPGTASGLGVKQDWWYDGRRDILASTKAALSYLDYLFDFFNGNPLLALAAYNSGEGSVMNAIKHNARLGLSTDFWSLNLPKETKLYVPRILALAIIISHPEYYNLRLPQVANEPYLAQVDIGHPIDFHSAAKLAGISLHKLETLNPGFNHFVTHPHGPYKLVLPIENIEKFMSKYSNNKPQVKWIKYQVKKQDTLSSIAHTFATSIKSITQVNRLLNGQIKPGQAIVIPQPLGTPPSTINSNNLPPANNTCRIHYLVRKHDTAASIAKQLHTTSSVVLASNHHKALKPGTYIDIPNQPCQHQLAPKPALVPHKPAVIGSGKNQVYRVVAGDNFTKIANKFHISVAKLKANNPHIHDQLKVGQALLVT